MMGLVIFAYLWFFGFFIAGIFLWGFGHPWAGSICYALTFGFWVGGNVYKRVVK